LKFNTYSTYQGIWPEDKKSFVIREIAYKNHLTILKIIGD